MALKGNLSSVAALKRKLNELPRTMAQEVAKRGTPVVSEISRRDYDGGRNVYGEARPLGVNGQQLDLVASGAVRRSLGFRQLGTQIRCVLTEPYAKYLIGKYGILPNGPLPAEWAQRLGAIVHEVHKP